uniref:NADH-ubiquinone oxidoreductase chain 2 n=1 Tax=Solenostomus cyanopterus TaxID=270527 RepID=A7BHR2_9TELE|nr:NADH dehydrogenase subunit 2 [Solenostomus cyanopterus]BAF74887.1 NADH dehydrogenase subunit 2 [Solenostomus cyanopterus]BBU25684.1 NADH dehydrogenase subunit 2 [Solenostomus cyanopterus]
MNPYILLTTLSCLGLGTLMTVSSSNWLLAWMGLEVSTMAILPIMSKLHHPRAVEATTKYFLVQAAAAATMLFASLINANASGDWNLTATNEPLAAFLLTSALSLKLGIAPLHTWMPEVLQGLDLVTALIVSTWQKLAPFSLLVQCNAPHQLTLILGVTSILVGGWGGLNQTQTRKILAYSSIAHLGWMIVVSSISPSLSFFTLILYFSMTTTMFMSLHLSNGLNINTLASVWTKNPFVAATLPLVLMSLAGLPPLSGFSPKWMIISELANQSLIMLASSIALAALISLFFYLRLSYYSALTLTPNSALPPASWRTSTPKTALLPLSLAPSILILPISPAILSCIT